MHALGQLTEREKQILRLVARGHENKAIARQLNISVFTVQNHIQNLFERICVHNRTEAASVYWQHMSSLTSEND
jgi:DNA-binding NarL/FixJ family response regulator